MTENVILNGRATVGGRMGLISLGGVANTLYNISKTDKKIGKVVEKMATGKNIASGADSAVELQKIKALGAEIDGLEQANRNMSSASSLLDVAAGAQNQMISSLQELRALSVQAADETLSSQDRQALMQRANDLVTDIDRMARNTNYGGSALLDGSFSNRSVQVGAGEGDTAEFSIGSHRAAGLGVDTVDFSSASSSGNAITTIDTAIDQLMSEVSDVAATQKRFEFAEEANQSQILPEASAKSALEDLDYSQASVELNKNSVSRKAGVLLLQRSLALEKDSSEQLSLKL